MLKIGRSNEIPEVFLMILTGLRFSCRLPTDVMPRSPQHFRDDKSCHRILYPFAKPGIHKNAGECERNTVEPKQTAV